MFDIHTGPNISPPEFTLTCVSKIAPATVVDWMRGGMMVEEDGDHEASQVIVDTTSNTVYESRLQVRGREGGDYQCKVTTMSYRETYAAASLALSVQGWLSVHT